MGPPKRTVSVPATQTPPLARLPPHRMNSAPLERDPSEFFSIRHHITFSDRKFDVRTLPADLSRVYAQLAEDFGEEYALTFVFSLRTACELHRAWHMTLLTNKILLQIKQKFNLRMTWNLGVVALKFRVEDGRFELHRKVPYDYDSEYQDLYMKTAVALVEEHINIHEALIFQAEIKQGLHTARSGKFLRDAPGRLVLYPLVSMTCAVIFFGGSWADGGVAAACGLASGLMEYALSAYSDTSGAGDVKILIDVMVGFTTGVVGGLFYRFLEDGTKLCLSSIFLGTLYWFFYGTAFVIGLLEIIAGELETGVTRFIAVSVKTFVLTLGSAIGLQVTLARSGKPVFDSWTSNFDQCNSINLDEQAWRIPLYLLCSASVLGQYRFPIANYWRGLVVQLVGYEVQYQMFSYFEQQHDRDFLDTACSNIAGAAAAVAAASVLSYIVDESAYYYNARLLQRAPPRGKHSCFGNCMYSMTKFWVKTTNILGIGRKSSLRMLEMEHKLEANVRELKDPKHDRKNITLTREEEIALVEAIVEAEDLNVWSVLMPAVYQLVPGSMIAKLWYNAVFPPPLETEEKYIGDTNIPYEDTHANPTADDVFYGLWVISTSLALGLLLGFAIVQLTASILMIPTNFFRKKAVTDEEKEAEAAMIRRMQFRQQGVMKLDADDDPSEAMEEDASVLQGSGEPEATMPLKDTEKLKTTESEQHVKISPMHCASFDHLAEDNQPIPTIAKMQLEKAEEEGFEIPGNV